MAVEINLRPVTASRVLASLEATSRFQSASEAKDPEAPFDEVLQAYTTGRTELILMMSGGVTTLEKASRYAGFIKTDVEVIIDIESRRGEPFRMYTPEQTKRGFIGGGVLQVLYPDLGDKQRARQFQYDAVMIEEVLRNPVAHQPEGLVRVVNYFDITVAPYYAARNAA